MGFLAERPQAWSYWQPLYHHEYRGCLTEEVTLKEEEVRLCMGAQGKVTTFLRTCRGHTQEQKPIEDPVSNLLSLVLSLTQLSTCHIRSCLHMDEGIRGLSVEGVIW